MLQEASGEIQTLPAWGVAAPSETGYQVPEGKSELINRNSLIFTLGRSISLIGDGFYQQTLIVWISFFTMANARTAAEQATAALTVAAIQAGIFAAHYLGNLLVVPFASIFADRLNRRTMMITADIFQAGLTLLPLGAFFVAKNVFIPTIYVSYFLLVGFAGLFTSAQGGALQVIVSRRKLPQAVSLLTILLSIGSIFGALFASQFFLAYGPVVAILFNAVSFLISAASLALLRMPREALHPYAYRQGSDSAPSAGIGGAIKLVFKDVGRGFRFIFTTRILVALVVLLIVAELGGGSLNAVSSGFFFTNLHANPKTDIALLGLIPAGLQAGAVIGALLVSILVRYITLKVLAVVSVILLGLLAVGTALQTTLISGVIFFVLMGVFNGMFLVVYGALVLKITPNAIVGRVQGALAPITLATGLLATIIVGAIVQSNTTFSPLLLFQSIIITAGVVIVVGGLAGMAVFRNAKEELVSEESLVAPAATVASEGVENVQLAGEGEV